MARGTLTHSIGLLTVALCAHSFCSVAWADSPYPGWTLYFPSRSGSTYLVDLDGYIVHTWSSDYNPGLSGYLVDAGAIARTANDANVGGFGSAGRGGRLQRIAWDGELEWDFALGSRDFVPHHDIEPLPNGNVLAIVWERYTADEAIALGRDPSLIEDDIWADAVYEIEPSGTDGGTIVWSWHTWDWLVQDYDPNRPNYGDPADYPHRIDINFAANPDDPDWMHSNGIDYNAKLDQIVISPRRFSEIWIISHANAGGLIYRWGNPQAYGRGTTADQQLEGQHNPEWIPEGTPGTGNIILFNNGADRGYSSIDELIPPLQSDGTYQLEPGQPYEPVALAFTCDEIDGQAFLQSNQSGVQRLPNGNSLICLTNSGRAIEVDENCESVWSYSTTSTFRATRIGARDSRLAGLLFCYGDLDGDGVLDMTDVEAFLAELGSTGGDSDADFNEDGDVDMLDFQTLQIEFGTCG